MVEDIDIAHFDALITTARKKFQAIIKTNPAMFGGTGNPRIEATIGDNSPLGTIDVPPSIDISTTSGLMAKVDLTLLNRSATDEDIKKIATRAKSEPSATVCVYPEHVKMVQAITGGNPPAIAVVGFPFVIKPGEEEITATLNQTRAALTDGAKEIDMVLAMNFKDGLPDYQAHYNYIRKVVEEAAKSGAPVKVILETAYLNDEQKVEASMLAKIAGATFVKTSTGFAIEELMNPDIPKTQIGATPHDVALMRRTVGDTTLTDDGITIPMEVKASGGVRNREQAIALYRAGASRIGASGGIDVRTELEKQIARSSCLSSAEGRAGGY